jgi:hypothetical protein
MIHKLTNRAAVRKSQWVADIQALAWKDVTPPSASGLGVQPVDLLKNLDGNSIARKLNEKFMDVAARLVDPAQIVASDGEMAVSVHRAFEGITLREAADADLWAHLSTMACPQYVRWRWHQRNADLPSRFAGNIRRNALARLWWWAEITHDAGMPPEEENRYEETLKVANRQDFILYALDCTFSGHRGLVRQLTKVQLSNAQGSRSQQKLCRSVNRIARVVCLDALQNKGQLDDVCQRAYEVSLLLR